MINFPKGSKNEAILRKFDDLNKKAGLGDDLEKLTRDELTNRKNAMDISNDALVVAVDLINFGKSHDKKSNQSNFTMPKVFSDLQKLSPEKKEEVSSEKLLKISLETIVDLKSQFEKKHLSIANIPNIDKYGNEKAQNQSQNKETPSKIMNLKPGDTPNPMRQSDRGPKSSTCSIV